MNYQLSITNYSDKGASLAPLRLICNHLVILIEGNHLRTMVGWVEGSETQKMIRYVGFRLSTKPTFIFIFPE